MKMDNEEQVAIILNIITIILLKKKKCDKNKKKKRKIWSRQWLLRRDSNKGISHLVFKELQFEDPNSFQNYVRMRKDTFFLLLNKIKSRIGKTDTVLRESIPASTRLLVTLRFLATGSSYTELSYNYRISVPAISSIVPETLEAIYNALKDSYLKIPTNKEEWKKVAHLFEKQWNFPHCLGAIDGKHIAFRARKEDGSYYYNYKNFNSIILMALVDANYNFLYVDVGCNGRVNDAGVYAKSTLCRAIEENLLDFPEDEPLKNNSEKFPYVIVGDEAFRLTPRIMKPMRQRNITENKIFNYRLSRARRVVENAFGILANKFQILQKEISLSVEKVELITLTTCVLHNYIREHDGKKYVADVDVENTDDVTLTPGRWRKDVFQTGLETATVNRSSDIGIKNRLQFVKYFNNEGFVPWQWESIKKFNF